MNLCSLHALVVHIVLTASIAAPSAASSAPEPGEAAAGVAAPTPASDPEVEAARSSLRVGLAELRTRLLALVDALDNPKSSFERSFRPSLDEVAGGLDELTDESGSVRRSASDRVHRGLDKLAEAIDRFEWPAATSDDQQSPETAAEEIAEAVRDLGRSFGDVDALKSAKERAAERKAKDQAEREAKKALQAEKQAEKDATARAKSRKTAGSGAHAVARQAWASDKRMSGQTYASVRRKAENIADCLEALAKDPSDQRLQAVRAAFDAMDRDLAGRINDGATRPREDQVLGSLRGAYRDLRGRFEKTLHKSDR